MSVTNVDSILIGPHGERMIPPPEGNKKDYDQIGEWAGVHLECRGLVNLTTVSDTHKALSCKKCQLRTVIPSHVLTYQDLRNVQI